MSLLSTTAHQPDSGKTIETRENLKFQGDMTELIDKSGVKHPLIYPSTNLSTNQPVNQTVC